MLNDNSLMPFGKYKGTEMANVPASYLIWIYENNKCSLEVIKYVRDNLDVLTEEVKRENAKK
jgi:uncharacterized protein (DUF3820 family)